MNEEKKVESIRAYAFKHSDTDDIHGFNHTERVYKMCLNLGKKLNADLTILKIAALLHDIGRIPLKDIKDNRNHAEISAEIAKDMLATKPYNLSDIEIDKISHCILTHSFSNKLVPETLEAKILSDADKLDALGAIGLYRTIGFTVKEKGGIEELIEHLENKILKLKSQLYLDISKEIAEKREKIIIEFYKKLKEEN
ncbi:MAG: HD domain-containing protein [Promethearchaeota archaeon]|jgi:uncharacterized protein